jgi:hypothetical protein
MAVPLFANNASSTLAGGISDTQTTLAVQTGDASKFPDPTGGDWFMATIVDAAGNIEIVKCTARSGAILTVVRGQENTPGTTFSAGARIGQRWTAGTLDSVFSDIAGKADTSTVNAALALKADQADLTAGLALKADDAATTAALALKADDAATTAALATKADDAATTAALALKADASALATKADDAATTAALALKADAATVNSQLAAKADASTVNAQLAAKADASALASKANVGSQVTYLSGIVEFGPLHIITDSNPGPVVDLTSNYVLTGLRRTTEGLQVMYLRGRTLRNG